MTARMTKIFVIAGVIVVILLALTSASLLDYCYQNKKNEDGALK